jgi:hypothetical protein
VTRLCRACFFYLVHGRRKDSGNGISGRVAAPATPNEAQPHFEWMALFVAIDNPTSSALTRDALRWSPKESGLLRDMGDSGYFS